MVKEDGVLDNKDGLDNIQNGSNTENVKDSEAQQSEGTSDTELDAVKAQLTEKTKKCDEYFDMLQRRTAEFDNYRKRTAKEKETLYNDTVADVVSAFLPAIDNLERAIQASRSTEENGALKEGIEMVYKQIKDVLKNLGVEEIKCVGTGFDPQLHNAVMHIEDEAYGEGEIVEEFQKGYILQDKVIRHSMVKVAN